MEHIINSPFADMVLEGLNEESALGGRRVDITTFRRLNFGDIIANLMTMKRVPEFILLQNNVWNNIVGTYPTT